MFLLLQISLSIVVSAAQISQSSSNYTVVDIKGNGDYFSIQKAVDNAKSGSTIYVKNGEYSEIIKIKKSLTLIGEDKENTIISSTSERNKYGVLLDASNIKITGFSIYNKGPGIYTSAVRITESGNEIDDCNLYDTPIGITIWSSDNTISNSNFWGCTDEGIALIGSSHIKCENNKITNCIFYDNCDGIELQYSSSNSITDCDFYDNTHTGIDAIASQNNKNIISNCEIYNNRVHGIYISSSRENQIIDCDVFDNYEDDIVFNKYSENNEIINSEPVKNQETSTGGKSNINSFFQSLLDRVSDIRSYQIYNILKSFNF